MATGYEQSKEWRVAEAKNKFSELLDRASTQGPQRIVRRGEVFVVKKEDASLTERTGQDIIDLFQSIGGAEELALERQHHEPKDIFS